MDSDSSSQLSAVSYQHKLKIFLSAIRFEHSLFALPFAYLGMILAAQGLPSLKSFLLITFAMVTARTFGMTVNRLVDREIDAGNPRTQDNALSQGWLTGQFFWGALIASFLGFILIVQFLPRICFYLSPLAILAMVIYPYMKRFTWLSHLFLGGILAMAPVGSWLAIRGSLELPPFILAGGVLLWVAGFDIIYALQDYRFDLKQNLYSIPAKWGRANAIHISRFFHFVAVLFFSALLVGLSSGLWAWIGLVLAAALIIHEHRILVQYGLTKVNTAFFKANAWVSVVFFLGLSIDLFI